MSTRSSNLASRAVGCRTDPKLVERARTVLPGGITRSTVYVPPHPPYAVSGAGPMVRDDTGRELLDCNNNYTSLIHGHAHPDLVRAAVDAVNRGSAFGLPTHSELELAEHLRERTGIEKWRFCNSGTEAVLMLIRAARAHTGRELIVRFDGSYHGTGDEVVDSATPGVPPTSAQTTVVLPQGDLAALADTMRRDGHRIAAVLIDLMPNRAGLRPATQAFVHELRDLTRRHGALLAVDEVISFRLRRGGFHQAYDIKPDLISVGKVIGGGFPAGAVGGSTEVLSAFDPTQESAVRWGGTFSANPVTMSAGLAALRLYDRKSVEELNARGDLLRSRLRAADVPVCGSGSLIRVVASDDARLWWSLYDRGVLAGTNGLLALSTVMGDGHADRICEEVIAAWRS